MKWEARRLRQPPSPNGGHGENDPHLNGAGLGASDVAIDPSHDLRNQENRREYQIDDEDHELDHVFALLSLVLDRDALGLALRALSSPNAQLRGTALEYIENVVPEPLRSQIRPYMPHDEPRQRAKRPEAELLKELERSFG